MDTHSALITSELVARFSPLIALIASLVVTDPRKKIILLLAAPLAALACGVSGLCLFYLSGAQVIDVSLVAGVGLRLDSLSVVTAVSIAFISSVVVWFSERNLLGSESRVRFIQHLVAVASVASLLFASDNLIFMLVCWHGISILLWRLVAMEPKAVGSARLVLFHHLFSDACFLAATVLIVLWCGTSDLSQIAAHAAVLQDSATIGGHVMPFSIATVVGLLLLLAMFCKSALFPFHRWLLATIDAPTPLSGLLHAGVVNVSAILAARLLPVLVQSTSVLVVWSVWTAVCAIVATLIMSARSDTKGELVFSTVGQMAFMLLECQIAAVLYYVDPYTSCVFIAAAVFHLIAHGCFKCMMFLQSHSSISEGQTTMRYGYPAEGTSDLQGALRLAMLVLMALPACFLLLRELSVDGLISLSVVVTAVAVGSTVPVMKSVRLSLLLPAGAVFLLLVIASGFVGEKFEAFESTHPLHTTWILPFCLLAFAVIGLGLNYLRSSKFGKWLYVQFLNGLYIEDIGDFVKGRFFSLISLLELKRRTPR
jgi:NADH:ubiquinone oxidoreductase subunit 5 (subunit L)/multisubunit Na+/H+ antiporter MnhA subunit